MARDIYQYYVDIRRVLNKHDPLGTQGRGPNDHRYDALIESAVEVTRNVKTIPRLAARLKALFEVMYGASKIRATEWTRMAEELQDAVRSLPDDFGG
jgi:hypothetical protein